MAVPPAEQDLWERVRYQITLAEYDHPRIDAERAWYESNPRYMQRVSQRAQPYLYHVVTEVERRGMPIELALLPIMESAYDPFAYSHGRAAGMWQIIPGTGRQLGLQQDWWYDGRRDVRASTDAALDYLEQLHQRFDGDWLKALAAYNSGPGRVSKAVASNRKKGLPTDFWSLKLPRETRSYVPRFLALAQIVKDPARHGTALTPAPNQPWFIAVPTGGQIDLAQAAELAGLDIEQLYLLNPGYSRWATSPQGPHELLVPRQHAAPLADGLASLDPAQRVQWERYSIQQGDTLSTIARRFNTDVVVLREVNDLKDHRIRAGRTLMIPTATEPAEAYSLSSDQRLARKTDKQRQGERHEYRVQAGDSFWTISRQFGVSTRQLAEWNGMAVRDPIREGQRLIIWRPLTVAANASLPERREAVQRKLGYKVRNGDSLARIAGKFNVSVDEIVDWNTGLRGSKYIHPGQTITLYVDVAGG